MFEAHVLCDITYYFYFCNSRVKSSSLENIHFGCACFTKNCFFITGYVLEFLNTNKFILIYYSRQCFSWQLNKGTHRRCFEPGFCCISYDCLGPPLTVIPALTSNYTIYTAWNEISHPFPNSNSATVSEWISNFIPHVIGNTITCPCWLIYIYIYIYLSLTKMLSWNWWNWRWCCFQVLSISRLYH